MHDLSGPVMLLLGAAASGIHLLGGTKPLTRIAIQSLIHVSMLVIGLAGVGNSSPHGLVLSGWVAGTGAMVTVGIALLRKPSLRL